MLYEDQNWPMYIALPMLALVNGIEMRVEIRETKGLENLPLYCL